MQITKTSLQAFRTEFAQAVAALEQKHGVKIELGNIGFTEADFHGKLTVTNVGASGEKQVSKQEQEINELHATFDLQLSNPGLLAVLKAKNLTVMGLKFKANDGGVITITGYNTRAKSMPFHGTKNGRGVKFPGSYIEAARIVA